MTDADDMLSRLGGIVVLWAHVEHWLSELLTALVEANPALMYVVTGNVSASTVAAWIRTLLDVRGDTDSIAQEVRQLLQTIDELRSERNTLIHGLWAFDTPDTALVQTVRWERAEVVKQEVVTLADLDELSTAISEALEALRALGARHGFPVMV